MKTISDEVEEYLEALYRKREEGKKANTNDLAKDLGVKPASVSEMLKKMSKMKLVNYRPYYGATLTKKGETLGKRIIEKHRLIERFLEFIGVKKKVCEEACILEHAVSDEVEKKIEKMMERAGVLPLAALKNGMKGKVVYISADKKTTQRLMDMGLTERTHVVLTHTAPFRGPLELRVRGTRLALGRNLAAKIFVRLV